MRGASPFKFELDQAGVLMGSCLRGIDSRITQLNAQGPSGTCSESDENEDVVMGGEGCLTVQKIETRGEVQDVGCRV